MLRCFYLTGGAAEPLYGGCRKCLVFLLLNGVCLSFQCEVQGSSVRWRLRLQSGAAAWSQVRTRPPFECLRIGFNGFCWIYFFFFFLSQNVWELVFFSAWFYQTFHFNLVLQFWPAHYKWTAPFWTFQGPVLRSSFLFLMLYDFSLNILIHLSVNPAVPRICMSELNSCFPGCPIRCWNQRTLSGGTGAPGDPSWASTPTDSKLTWTSQASELWGESQIVPHLDDLQYRRTCMWGSKGLLGRTPEGRLAPFQLRSSYRSTLYCTQQQLRKRPETFIQPWISSLPLIKKENFLRF